VAAELDRIVEVWHAQGNPLVVDEAWAAHLPWHSDLPVSGVHAGADLTIHSVHKSGAGLLQASVRHINGDLADPDEIGQRMDLLATTSASPLVDAPLTAGAARWPCTARRCSMNRCGWLTNAGPRSRRSTG
jgi:lysine decarboxylase